MKELQAIQSRLKVKKERTNISGGYAYRSYEDINTALKPLLKEMQCTLIINDDVVMVGDRIYVKATATITNGGGTSVSTSAFARESHSQANLSDGQATGAASSYARKYALCGLFLIDSGIELDDDDSEPPTAEKKVTARCKKITKQTEMP